VVRPAGRPKPPRLLSSKDGGFSIEVRAVAGDLWYVEGNSPDHTVADLKERLVAKDARFCQNRADLALDSKILGDAETLGGCKVRSGSRLACVFSDLKAAVLIIGGGVAGRTAIKELSGVFKDQPIILIDPQEFSEHACGIARAYADPVAWEALIVRHEDWLANFSNVQFVQGEVIRLRPGSATVLSSRDGAEFNIRFEYCVVTTGCSFAPVNPAGESLWKPTSGDAARRSTRWSTLDERTIGGRRRRIMAEHRRIWEAHDSKGAVLIVGADYQGVEWACELRQNFPQLRIILIDHLPRCLATLPLAAAEYAEQYMQANGICTCYSLSYEPDNPDFWERCGLQGPADVTYVLRGVSARNGFMPSGTVSSHGPGGGGWIVTNLHLQVCVRRTGDRPIHLWAGGRVFAAGDCHYGAVVGSGPGGDSSPESMAEKFIVPPVPKTAHAAVSWARAACRNIAALHNHYPMENISWPSESGIIAVSLGTKDGVVVWKVKWTRDSGEVVLFGAPAAEMKKRLTWPDDRNFLADPTSWLPTLQMHMPTMRLLSERGRAALRLSGRAW